uniref:Uncharacterized protein n=1 Tax=Cryptococcus bacillisporus CA1280 TaxID=1296109 RepID=A0A0D0U890_CRYGA|nr:hypothetical protein I312_06303 [Cryptococcus bacillisporus CA1280]
MLLSERPKVTKFSVSSIDNIETRLIPHAVRAAAVNGILSLPRCNKAVSSIMEVLMPAVTITVSASEFYYGSI